MKIKFWGVRGSIPSPGPKTVRYGGNTTCIYIETDEGEHIILDAGTGIFPLAHTLLSKLPLKCHIFLTHTHWDHIQGLPFFVPIFIPGNVIDIYGAFDLVTNRNLKDVLSRQMDYTYFPVREAELKAEIKYHVLHERQTINIGSTKVTNVLMNHPVLNFGYRIDNNGKSMFFTGDNEPLYNIYDPADDFYGEYEKLMAQKNNMIFELIQGVDVLIADAAYTDEEYKMKRGWGHGTHSSCIEMSKVVRPSALYLTHHEPTRSDDDLEKIYQNINVPSGDTSYFLAKEGLEIIL
ncbi:MAG: MBL fold metallo-hydrolase [Nitrospirae bacterium]|nr:MBL fold metallo-hydrolase [Nitrospirota bacterium]